MNPGLQVIEIGKRAPKKMHRISHTESLRQKLQYRRWCKCYFPHFRCSDATRRKDVCIIDALRLLGVKAPYDRDGPLWARADANDILTPFGMTLTPQARITSIDTGKFIVISCGHAIACRIYEDGDAWHFERGVRERLSDQELYDMAKSSSIFRLESLKAVEKS